MKRNEKNLANHLSSLRRGAEVHTAESGITALRGAKAGVISSRGDFCRRGKGCGNDKRETGRHD